MTRTRLALHPSVFPALRPTLPALGGAAVGAALSGTAALGALWGIIRLLDQPSRATALVVCGAFAGAAALSAGSSWLAHAAEARFAARLRREIAQRVLRLPATRVSSWPSDRLRRVVSEDVSALHHLVAHFPSEIATLVVVPACAVALLLRLAGPAALTALIPGVLAALVYLTLIPRLSAQYGAERGRVMGEITTAVDDYSRGIQIFRSSGDAEGALARYRDATHRFSDGMVSWVRRVATPAAVAVALLQAAASYAIAYAVGFARDTPSLAATLLLSLALVTPALRLGHGLDYVAAGRAAAERIGALLAEPAVPRGTAEFTDDGTGTRATGLSLTVSDRALLRDVSLHAPPAALTAVTGPSGAGKSTLLRVLAGQQLSSAGVARLGGVAVSALTEDALGRAVLLVPQGVAPLSASVRDNLLLGVPDASEAACARALARAQLTVELDAGADTLSGGERQRLALARAFLSSARVILVDEPTSALDAVTGARVWDELARLAHEERRTVIAVTHDPQLAARADQRCDITPATMTADGAA